MCFIFVYLMMCVCTESVLQICHMNRCTLQMSTCKCELSDGVLHIYICLPVKVYLSDGVLQMCILQMFLIETDGKMMDLAKILGSNTIYSLHLQHGSRRYPVS